MSKVFFDTNILFYAFDTADVRKQKVALELLANALTDGTGYTSVQVLGEFFHSAVIRKKNHFRYRGGGDNFWAFQIADAAY